MDRLRARGAFDDRSFFETGAELDPQEALSQLQRKSGEGDEEFVKRAVDVLHRSIAHFYERESARESRWHVPPTDNLFLWIAGFISPRVEKYAFCNYERAVRRGVGLCGQQARALTSVLREGGIDARPVAFDGHVLVEARVSGDRWVLDSDYNVVITEGINYCRSNPEKARQIYEETAAPLRPREGIPEESLRHIEDIFTAEPGTISPKFGLHHRLERVLYLLHYSVITIAIGGVVVCLFKLLKSA